MKLLIDKLKAKHALSSSEVETAFNALLDPDLADELIREFLILLSEMPLKVEWLTAAAKVLREHALAVKLPVPGALDTAGTGGDQSGFFNFSTASALLAAACGVPVAKHGNRSITSNSGSADLLEALGIPIDLDPEGVVRSIEANNFAFMMAPKFHPATHRVQKIRRELRLVTLFNFLGPLLNPARVPFQIIGVYDNDIRPLMAETLLRLGTQRAWVVYGEGGVDELTLSGETYISEVTPQGIQEKIITPEDAVLRRCEAKFLRGGDAQKNAKLLWGIFEKAFFGPLVNGVLYGTGAGLVVAGHAEDIRDGVRLARLAIEEGKAVALLDHLIGNKED